MTNLTRPPAAAPLATPPGRHWWTRPWIVPLTMLAVVFVVYSLPPYLSLDASQSRVPPPEGVPFYFGALSLHVVFGSIAMLTCCFQVWPWFRAKHPGWHRVAGRIYVFGGVLPGGIVGLYIVWNTPFGPSARVSGLIVAALWLTFTVVGLRMALRRRFVEHRRWMLRSFALTMSIVLNRVFGIPAVLLMLPQLDTAFDGNQDLLIQSSTSISTWLSWTVALLAVEWWLERGTSARGRAAARRQREPRRNVEPVG